MISVVVPVFNEEESLESFYRELIKVIPSLDGKYEIIFVDDGSTDDSFRTLKKFEKENKNIRIFSFRKNQGKAEALTLGFQKARGDFIVTLDADLQDKPSEIPKLLKKAENGFDLVCGFRKNRQDPLPKILSSKLFNFVAGILWEIKLHDYNCGLKVYSKEAAKSLNLYGGLHRFIPLLADQQGFLVTEIEVEHRQRKYGKSKYGFSKLWKDLPDMFTMFFLSRYGSRPMHFFGIIGALLLFFGMAILVYLTVLKLEGLSIGRRPLLFLGMLLVISGLEVFFTGFLADLIIHISQRNKVDNNGSYLRYSSD